MAEPPAANGDAHLKIIGELQGQTVHVPDLLTIFDDWPQGGRNKYYKRLKAKLDSMTVACHPDLAKRQRAMKNDFALFASIWYPDADWMHLLAVGIMGWWTFLIDDSMDGNQDSNSLDMDASSKFRAEILTYTRYCLALAPIDQSGAGGNGLSSHSLLTRTIAILKSLVNGNTPAEPEPPCPSLVCSGFIEFGRIVQQEFSQEFREMFWADLKTYFDHVDIEQRERLNGVLTDSFDAYLQLRLHTTAVRVFCFVTQIASGAELPSWLIKTPEMNKLWELTNMNILISNDIFSLRKELKLGCVHNSVCVMYHAGQPLDAIIPHHIKKLEAVRHDFDETAQKVRQLAARLPRNVRFHVDRHIDGLRNTGTGTIEWSKIDRRYGIQEFLNNDGTMDIVL